MSTATMTTGRRGLIAAVCVVLAVVAAVFMVSMRSTGTVPSVSRKLVGPSSLLENKMAFKAMKMNTKYELKSEQKTILRGGSIQIRHDAAAAMKANIYSGIKDMKRVVLAGLDKGKRRLAETTSAPAPSMFHRMLPGVHVIKGAYGAMKGQIKTTLKVMKPLFFAVPASTHTGDLNALFAAKHAAVHEMKHQIKGAITNERQIIENDDDDDTTPAPKADAAIAKEDATLAKETTASLESFKETAGTSITAASLAAVNKLLPSSSSSASFSASVNAHTPTAVSKAAMMASSGKSSSSKKKSSSKKSSSSKKNSSSKKSDK